MLAEGLDPDDPPVRVAIDLVRWELSLLLDGRRRSAGLVFELAVK